MNNDLISLEAALNHIKSVFCQGCNNYDGIRCRACEVDDVMGVLDGVPIVDGEPVRHGRWEYSEDDVTWWWMCSEGENVEILPSNYCPDCGAKMDGGETNDQRRDT